MEGYINYRGQDLKVNYIDGDPNVVLLLKGTKRKKSTLVLHQDENGSWCVLLGKPLGRVRIIDIISSDLTYLEKCIDQLDEFFDTKEDYWYKESRKDIPTITIEGQQCPSPTKGWEKYCKMREPYVKMHSEMLRAKKLLMTPEMNDKPDDIGDLMTLEDFVDNVNCGGFIDYDGYGYYSTKDKVTSNITIRPSDVKKNEYRKDFTHIVWYNR